MCTSPLRLAAAGLAAIITHPALTIGVTAAIAAAITVIGVLVIWRGFRDFGWRLVVTSAATGRHAR